MASHLPKRVAKDTVVDTDNKLNNNDALHCIALQIFMTNKSNLRPISDAWGRSHNLMDAERGSGRICLCTAEQSAYQIGFTFRLHFS